MSPKELFILMSENSGLDKDICEKVLMSFVCVSKKAMQQDKTIKIKNFGSFRMYKTKPRQMKSFGKIIKTDSKRKIKFVSSTNLTTNNKLSEILNKI